MVTQQNTQNQLFRKEALEKVATPEQLDQLIRITSPQRWFSLFAVGSLVAAGLAWSILGRIPIAVTGKGVLIYPNKVVTVQASNPGRILELNVEVGDTVKKGQILATIDQSELKKQLQLSRDKLTQLQIQDQTATQMQIQRDTLAQTATHNRAKSANSAVSYPGFTLQRIRSTQARSPKFAREIANVTAIATHDEAALG